MDEVTSPCVLKTSAGLVTSSTTNELAISKRTTSLAAASNNDIGLVVNFWY